MVIEPKPGTYVLILSCASNAHIQIGCLGIMQLQRGYYVYVGSSLGPRGLRARIALTTSSRGHGGRWLARVADCVLLEYGDEERNWHE
jgi:Uri superfamily endonuclease